MGLVALVIGVAATGCGGEDSGAATPTPIAHDQRPLIPTPATTDAPTATATPTPDVRAAATAGLEACDLLTASEQRGFGVGAGAADKIGRARACQWQASGRYTIGIGIFDDLNIHQVVS